MTAYETQLDIAGGHLTSREIDASITRQTLVTVRQPDEFDIDAVVGRCDASPDLAEFGVAYPQRRSFQLPEG